MHTLPPHDLLCCGFPCRTFSRAGGMQCDLRLIQHVLTKLAPQTGHMILLENTMTFPTIDGGKALAAVLGWLEAAGCTRIEHRVLSVAAVTGLPQARRRWVCVATKPTPPIPGLAFRWPSPIPEPYRQVLAEVLEPTPKYLPCSHIHATAPPLTERTHRLHQRGYRRANTQHCRIYDARGLAPTVSTTSAINVWADETRVRLLQPRELARLQGLNHFHLPTGRVVATRLIGNAIPPALVVALFE